MRVHELAKEYGIKSTEFVDIIQDFGIDIKSHLSTIDDVQVATIRQELSEKEEEPLAKAIGAGEVKKDDWTLGSGETVMEVADGVSIHLRKFKKHWQPIYELQVVHVRNMQKPLRQLLKMETIGVIFQKKRKRMKN